MKGKSKKKQKFEQSAKNSFSTKALNSYNPRASKAYLRRASLEEAFLDHGRIGVVLKQNEPVLGLWIPLNLKCTM